MHSRSSSLVALSALTLFANLASAQPAPAPKPPAPKAPAAQPDAAPKPDATPKPDAAPKPGAAPKPAPPKPGAAPKPAAPPKAPPPAEGEEGEEAAGTGEEETEAEPETPPTPPAPPEQPTMPGFTPMPMWPQPGSDQRALAGQSDQKPKATETKADKDAVYAEDWWSHARPIFELHGYFRLRAELFHNFSLGRIDSPDTALWPKPSDNQYAGTQKKFGPTLCTEDEAGIGDSDDPADGLHPCNNKTQSGANLRFRLNPELHISDNLRILSQIDLLDNLVLGSTPEGYNNTPGKDGGYDVVKRSGYAPLGAFDNTQAPPSAGQNSFKDSVQVKRVWAEYLTPVGQLRFGRMPSHWGLGILANAGDGHDDDYQSTADRIMFVTGLKSLDLYLAGIWDFANEGPISENQKLPQAQAYDLGQLDDVDQYVLALARRKNPELTKLALAQGNLVLNGGVYVVHRRQLLANDVSGGCGAGANALGCSPENLSGGYVRRGATAWIPDLWLQLLYKKFRFEAEVVTIQGSIENLRAEPGSSDYVNADGENGWKIRQWGYATEIEQKLVEDRLRLGFHHGWASGDPDVFGPQTGAGGLSPGLNGLQLQRGDRTISTFRFHPAYRVDLILHRYLLSRVQGTYYFRPSVDYDFVRNPSGQRFGGGFAAIWSRASQFVQTPGHKRDLGIELDLSLYYQAKDGVLNDDPDKMGGFYTMLQYGVLFPLGGLGFQTEETNRIIEDTGGNAGAADTSTAQILRWYLGVLF